MASVLWVTLPLLLIVTFAYGDDFTTVEERLLATIIPTSSSSLASLYSNAKTFSTELQPGGYWKDINYTDPNRVVWPATTHLSRLLIMSTAYVSPGQAFYESSALYKNVTLALNYWLQENFINPNWWWNEISVPTSIAQISFLLKSFLTETQIIGCVKIMDRADWTGWTGANLVWMANVHIYRGFVTNNASDVADAFAHIYGTISIADGINEGIKMDGSFYQHGQQLYSGGYGAAFTQTILPYLNITANTSYYVDEVTLSTFSLLVLDGQQWMTFYGIWDDMVVGRQITRPDDGPNTFSTSYLAMVDGPRHQEWLTFAEVLEKKIPQITGNKHFWKSDYMVHRRDTYSASIRMYSTRTYNSECVNEEGLLSLHLADGVFSVYQTGLEFDGIYPAWDWERIPGTTCALGEVPISCTTLKVLGKTDFVGGVSDGSYGATAHDFKAALNGKLSARKAWFLFANEIVALGANITCSGCGFPIVTTINQCDLIGDVYVSDSASPLQPGNRTLDNPWWVWHDNVGYVFPQSGARSVGLANSIQNGTWESINLAYSGNVDAKVFNFWINQHDKGDTYAYIVVPGVPQSNFSTAANRTTDVVSILSNSGSLQAVYHSGLQILQAVFWDAGTLKLDAALAYVTTNFPVILMISFNESTVSVYVSEPTQQQNQTVQIRLGMALKGTGCVEDNGETVINVQMPNGEFAGQTVATQCDV